MRRQMATAGAWTLAVLATVAALILTAGCGQPSAGRDDAAARSSGADPSAAEAKILEAIRSSDRVYTYGGPLDVKGLTVEIRGDRDPEGAFRRALELDKLSPVVEISFLEIELSDAVLDKLKELKSLRSLAFYKTRLGTRGLRAVAEFSDLEALQFDRVAVGDAGFGPLTALTHLRFLRLPYCNVTDEEMAVVGRLSSLRDLDLKANPCSDAAMKSVGRLKDLRQLTLDNTQVTDAGLRELRDLRDLEGLVLCARRSREPVLRPSGICRSCAACGWRKPSSRMPVPGREEPAGSPMAGRGGYGDHRRRDGGPGRPWKAWNRSGWSATRSPMPG